ncbi:hypothetical protein [Winogradskyella sp.]|uniref:hypothetical protein n=1 Tax=Winogradskyella sp. TaxID=1883156 RepID=UPI0026274535|nr:hypothetical protein [Winogradskyella sp.]
MKKNYLSLISLLLVLTFGYGQIYTENFTGQNGKGAVGPTPTIDVSGVTWSIDVSSAALTATTDWFQVVNEVFEARDIDGNAIWLSPSINISSYTNVSFSLGASEQGTMEAADIFNTEYRIDGGIWTAATTNGNLNDDFTSATVSQTGLLGNTLEIRVTMNNNAGAEYHRLDNIIVDGTLVGGGCNISDIALSNTGACNDNGTASDASDDYYTADITITYSNAPASGTIDLTGTGVVGGTTSAAVGTSPQTIMGVQLAANGSDVEIIATFSADATCNYTETVVGSGVASCSSSGGTDCADESFANIPTTSSGQYLARTWTGDDGFTWNATNSRTDLTINGSAITMNDDTANTYVESSSVPGGIGDLTISTQRKFGGGSGNLNVLVNGTNVGTVPYDDTVTTTTITGINISGNVVVTIANDIGGSSGGGADRVAIDDLSWTCFSCSGTPADATNFMAAEVCGAVDLTWDAPTCADEVLIIARETSAVTAIPTGDGSAYTADTQFGNGTALLAGQFAVYKSTGTSASITGLTGGSTYHFTIFSRVGSTWSSGATANVTYTGTIENPTSFTSFNDCGDIGLQWTNPTCFDEILVVARASNTVTATPTGDGSAYTADAQFGNGTALSAGEYAVYKDVSDNVTITGLTDGITYHFEIFTRVGNNWSSGATTSATASSTATSGPTTFSPGDIVFVGYDSYIGGSTDRYSLLNLVDIGVGTEFIMANLLYEWNAAANVSTNRWYDCDTDFDSDPPYAAITYNGCSDIPKGSIICIATNGSGNILYMTVNGISVTVGATGTEDFVVDAVNDTVGNISTTNADAMWLMQGTFSNVFSDIGDGNDNNAADDRYRTFTGTVLGALQTKGDFRLLTETGGNWTGTNSERRVSRIHPDTECVFLQTGTTSSTRFFGYHNGITSGTQYQLLADITDQSNWVLQSGTGGVQDSDNIDFLCGSSYTITGGGTNAGLWVGSTSNDWFDCTNWENFAVPNATVDVTIDVTAITNSKIDHTTANAAKFGGLAECNNLTITDSFLDISESNLNILTVNGDLTINGTGLLDMDDGNNGTDDGVINLLGNWINGIDESAFSEGNSTVVFASTTPQAISIGGPPLPPPGPFVTEEFYNITLDNDFNIDISGSSDRTLYAHGNLTINPGSTLTVQSGSYVHVGNILNTQGAIVLEDSANLIQVNDVNNTGNLTMRRNYDVDSSLDYIYWSSPVDGFSTNDLPVNNSHVYTWNPTAPNTGNGQGNWESAVAQTMVEGVGYIARSPGSVPSTMVFQNGVPHNGDVNLNLSRGTDVASDDDDWNLLGNPYPSSISALTFLTDNTNLEGFINLWTHGAIPSSAIADPFYENNGGFNYDPNDYITYNSTGPTTGPGTFNGYIASGQGFMVNTINGAASSTIAVSFTNDMRQRDYDNSNFFRPFDSNEKHRIWLDLASDNNGVNRVLLGYLNGATNEEDRLFDALTTFQDNEQTFYSIINNEPFVIQGRAIPFVDTDVIPLGYKCIESGNLTIAIHTVDGFFENDQNIYLKDNLLNLVHDLSNAPYSFTSETGEFNDRFEIVFTQETLSLEDSTISPNELTINELSNGNVQIEVSENLTIKTVEILDILGRQIYNLQGTSSAEIYNLSKLSNTAYIARVTLSNGQVISKKAIKQ